MASGMDMDSGSGSMIATVVPAWPGQGDAAQACAAVYMPGISPGNSMDFDSLASMLNYVRMEAGSVGAYIPRFRSNGSVPHSAFVFPGRLIKGGSYYLVRRQHGRIVLERFSGIPGSPEEHPAYEVIPQAAASEGANVMLISGEGPISTGMRVAKSYENGFAAVAPVSEYRKLRDLLEAGSTLVAIRDHDDGNLVAPPAGEVIDVDFMDEKELRDAGFGEFEPGRYAVIYAASKVSDASYKLAFMPLLGHLGTKDSPTPGNGKGGNEGSSEVDEIIEEVVGRIRGYFARNQPKPRTGPGRPPAVSAPFHHYAPSVFQGYGFPLFQAPGEIKLGFLIK